MKRTCTMNEYLSKSALKYWSNRLNLSKVWGSHSDEYENGRFINEAGTVLLSAWSVEEGI